jgi:glyoxylate/hydroxypyruvate reductase
MVNVLVAVPLDRKLVDRIAAVDSRLVVRHAPDLLPPPRFAGDHAGGLGFRRGDEQATRWDALAATTDVALGTGGSGPGVLAEFVRAAPGLRWVQGTTAGFGEQVTAAGLDDSTLRRVRFTTAAGLHGPQLAEFTLLVLLAFTKDLARLHADRVARCWVERPVRELTGREVVVVGLGHVGSTVARTCAALGMRVLGVRRRSGGTGPRPPYLAEEHPVTRLPDLIPRADAVVMAVPHTPETVGLLSRQLIAVMRPEAVVVNVGRGATIDEAALVEALRDGRIAGAGLDVFAVEPLSIDSPLWSLPNLVVSPHSASFRTTESAALVDLFCDNLGRYLAGAPLRNPVVATDSDRPGGGINDSSNGAHVFR